MEPVGLHRADERGDVAVMMGPEVFFESRIAPADSSTQFWSFWLRLDLRHANSTQFWLLGLRLDLRQVHLNIAYPYFSERRAKSGFGQHHSVRAASAEAIDLHSADQRGDVSGEGGTGGVLRVPDRAY
ncbi:hypothetical protein ACTG9Q_09730 [Actinokineospora sp. 24-640]